MEVDPLGPATLWLTKKATARRLGVSLSTLNRLLAEGRGPRSVVLRRRPLFTEQAIAEFIAKQATKAPTAPARRLEPTLTA